MSRLLLPFFFSCYLFFSFIPVTLADTINSPCTTNNNPTTTQVELFDTTETLPSGMLGIAITNEYSWDCKFSSKDPIERTLYIVPWMPSNVKQTLLDSGVTVYMVGNRGPENINLAAVQPAVKIPITTYPQSNTTITITRNYLYVLKRTSGPLKSFDTGFFDSAFHVAGSNDRIMNPRYRLRVKADKVNLCPNPTVSMDNKTVDFNELNAKDFINGNAIKRNFNLQVNVPEDCQTGLDISVTFNSNNGVVTNKKYLLLDNGLQAVITDKDLNQDINFGVPYKKGNVSLQQPGNYNYDVELSRESGKELKAGEFSKTVNVLFTYQ